MSKKKEKTVLETEEILAEPVVSTEEEVKEEETEAKQSSGSQADAPEQETPEDLSAELADMKDRFLRLAAEFDNFRRRTQKEKEAIYADAKIDAVKALLSVYDNLERALKQETADEAYKRGVEMTMTGLKKAFTDLGVTEIEAAGQPFDPKLHNAVMHVEDETLGESTVAEVFQAGFTLGDRVIRFAMVKVAN